MVLDKDIEIVKELVKNLKEKFKRISGAIAIMPRIEEEDVQAIENVLKELETYKKIARKLANEIDDYDTYNENEKYCQFEYGFCMLKDRECVDCIIEWARKEVEKDVKD